jgi:hypothetical protein
MLVFQNLASQQMPESNIYRNNKIENSKQYRSSNRYQKDLLLFVDMLFTTHPSFANKKTYPFNISDIEKKYYKTLENCSSDETFRAVLQNIVTTLHDGHTYISLSDFSNIEYYPLNIKVLNNKYYIWITDKKYEAILGKEIQSINEIPINTIISDFSQYISSDNSNESIMRISEYLLFPFLWKNFDYCRNDRLLVVKCSDGTTSQIQPELRKNFNLLAAKHNPFNALTSPNQNLFSYSITDDNKFCYLQFNNCFDYNSALYQIDMTIKDSVEKTELRKEIAEYPKFDVFLAKMFDDIADKNVQTLVIDVRNNSGGNSMLCKQLLSYLCNIKFVKTESGYIRISELFTKQYPELLANYKKIFDGKNKKLLLGKMYDLENFAEDEEVSLKYFSLNNDIEKIFSGNIVFCQEQQTYSSAGDLIVWARDNKIGVIIGSESIYRPCNYGDILTWKLPNTDMTGGISHKYFTRPDISKCGENCLIPDILISPTIEDIINGNDVLWDWIIDNYKQ